MAAIHSDTTHGREDSVTLCACGCGQPAPIAKLTNRRYGWIAGQPVRFVSGHHQRLKTCRSGYSNVSCIGHPRAKKHAPCVNRHILIAEAALGRYLPSGAEVHHVDENTLNNANSNLVICQDARYHALLHVRMRVLRAGGNPNTQRICSYCRQPKNFSEFYRETANKNDGIGRACRACHLERRRRRRGAEVV